MIMKTIPFRRKWYGVVLSVVALAAICLAVALWRPRPTGAIVTVESPAFIFAPVTVPHLHTARLCINHILGEGPVTTTMEFRDAADVNKLLATNTSDVEAQKGACFAQDAAALGSSGATRIIGIIRTVTLRNWRSTSPPIVSLQIQGANMNIVMAPALQGPAFRLPEP